MPQGLPAMSIPRSYHSNGQVGIQEGSSCKTAGTPSLPSGPPISVVTAPAPFTRGEVIPVNMVNRPRTLVVCFDGTGDQVDESVSNVVQFFRMLQKDAPQSQMVYYQSGIGTYTGNDNSASQVKAELSKVWDQAVAWNLADHVRAGYKFLMQNYVRGDNISLFGFSRGAYTARALAGMIHKMGLLPPGNEQQVEFAYNIFKRGDEASWATADFFKESMCITVRVDFVGVWDTVCSVGLIEKELPFTRSSNSIRCFRHAIALDERRAKFQSNGWHVMDHEREDDEERRVKYGIDWKPTDVKEVWFAGVHCDVGGGSVDNNETITLSKLSLRWMLKECFRNNTGILFSEKDVKEMTGLSAADLTGTLLKPATCQRTSDVHRTFSDLSTLSTEELTTGSALTAAPLTDVLLVKPGWWLLELWPSYVPRLGGNKKKANFVTRAWNFLIRHRRLPNLGHGRDIPTDKEFFVHHTVYDKLRKPYTVKPRWWWALTTLKSTRTYWPKVEKWDTLLEGDKIIWTS